MCYFSVLIIFYFNWTVLVTSVRNSHSKLHNDVRKTSEWVLSYLLFVISFVISVVLCLKTCHWISIQTWEHKEYFLMAIVCRHGWAVHSFNNCIACFDDKISRVIDIHRIKLQNFIGFIYMCSVVKCSNVIIHSSVKFKSCILNLFVSISGIKLLIGCLVFRQIFL